MDNEQSSFTFGQSSSSPFLPAESSFFPAPFSSPSFNPFPATPAFGAPSFAPTLSLNLDPKEKEAPPLYVAIRPIHGVIFPSDLERSLFWINFHFHLEKKNPKAHLHYHKRSLQPRKLCLPLALLRAWARDMVCCSFFDLRCIQDLFNLIRGAKRRRPHCRISSYPTSTSLPPPKIPMGENRSASINLFSFVKGN